MKQQILIMITKKIQQQDKKMDIQILDIEKIKNYEKNPRINVDAVEKVKESIQEFGFRQPIVTDSCRSYQI